MNSLQSVSEIRTQIYLPKHWHKQLKRKAGQRGVSLAAYIREKLRDDIDETYSKDREQKKKDFLKMAGFIKGDSPKDMSTQHGKYWAESIYKDMIKNRRKR